MTKKRMFLVLILAVFLSITPTQLLAASSDSDTHIEIVKSVSFRESASKYGEFIRYLKAGEKLDVIRIPNSYWYEARDSTGKLGFVSSSTTYTQLTTISTYPEPNGEIISSVSFRTGPSTSNLRIGYLAKGERVWILERVNDYWYKAEDKNHRVGYLSSNPKYVMTTFSDSTGSTDLDTHATNAQVLTSVSFRKGPSTSAERIRYLQAGERIQIIAKPNSYWYEAKDKNGTIGFVSTNSTYISTSFIEEAISIDSDISIELILKAGISYLGTPYEYGSSRFDTSTFDCSDFIRQIFLDGIGLQLPSDSRQQGDWVKQKTGGQAITDWYQLKRGDLMFFMSYKGSDSAAYTPDIKSTEEITHVGIYLGNDQVLHTYSVESGGVVISNVQGTHWENRFLFGGQALP